MLIISEVNMSKDKYLDNLKVGDLIAFKKDKDSNKMYSAKVTSKNGNKVMCISKQGSIHHILLNDIEWVKGNRWPRFVMQGFKMGENNNEYN